MLEQALGLLLMTANPAAAPPSVAGPVAILTHQRPDVSKAKPLERWVNARDMARLKSAEGKPQWMVLVILGHPSAIERRADGTEVWDYPWQAACCLWFKNGVCTGAFYSAGY